MAAVSPKQNIDTSSKLLHTLFFPLLWLWWDEVCTEELDKNIFKAKQALMPCWDRKGRGDRVRTRWSPETTPLLKYFFHTLLPAFVITSSTVLCRRMVSKNTWDPSGPALYGFLFLHAVYCPNRVLFLWKKSSIFFLGFCHFCSWNGNDSQTQTLGSKPLSPWWHSSVQSELGSLVKRWPVAIPGNELYLTGAFPLCFLIHC